MARQSLFSDSNRNWFAVAEHQKSQLENEVARFDENRLLNTSVDDLCNYFADKYRIDVPVLQHDHIVVGQREAKVDVTHRFDYISSGPGKTLVPGTTVEITVPFTGESTVFNFRPTTYSYSPPQAIISGNELIIEITGITLSADAVREEIKSTLAEIDKYLTWLRKDAESLNASLPGHARAKIAARRDKLLASKNLVSSLGFALKENPHSPLTYTASSVRRKLNPTPPPASSTPYRPEPSLSGQDYEHILGVLQNITHVMERSPAAFAKIDEESLRMHFLMQLNGHYEGGATGETFNFNGKTDILIREDGKNIFIGECKFWGGPKMLTETLNQLLSYSSWRDTKVAVLIFNRNKDLSKVLTAVQETVKGHPNCKRVVGPKSETDFRYVFSHVSDANREMLVAVLVFDVPS